MAAPLLITPEYVYLRSGNQQFQDVTDLISATISASTTYIEAVVGTTLTAGSSVEYFKLSDYESLSDVVVKCALKNGFVDTATPLVVSVSQTLQGLLSGASTVVSSSSYSIDAEKGLVTIFLSELMPFIYSTIGVQRDSFISISYAYGFTPVKNNFPDTTPEWLKEAAYQHTLYLLNKTPSLVVKDKEVKEPSVFKEIIAPRVRLFPDAIRPLF